MAKRLSNISNDKIKYYQLLGCHLNIKEPCNIFFVNTGNICYAHIETSCFKYVENN